MTPAPVPFDSPAVERGFGFFETILLVGRRAVLWEAHAARLSGSLRRLGLPAPSAGDLLAGARAAAEGLADDGAERGLRLTWIAVGHDLDDPASFRLDATVRAIPPVTLARRAGGHAVTLPGTLRRDSPWLKSTSYASTVLGLRHARQSGGNEGLLGDGTGRLVEGTGTALLAFEDGAWAGLGPLALQSVTAEAFLSGRGTRRAVTADEVRRGALLLGSLTTAVPVLSLDGTPCTVPEPMRAAAAAFNERLRSDPVLSTEL